MSPLPDLDRNKIVDLDLGSSEFKQNARSILAQWAKRPPFYVLSSGPPQVVCGRYADVHEVFSDTARFSSEVPRGRGFEQFDKFMGVQFITQMDGERHARIRRLLMPAFSSRSLSRLESRITEIIEGARRDREEGQRIRRHAGLRSAAGGRCAADCHGKSRPEPAGNFPRLPRGAAPDHLHPTG